MNTNLNYIQTETIRPSSSILDFSAKFLDEEFPLMQGSHQDVMSYRVYFNQLLACFGDGTQSGLAQPKQLIEHSHPDCDLTYMILKSATHHVEIQMSHKQGEHQLTMKHLD